ncbi:hypothetical protein DMH02_010530 [Streptomyces sp. WAC 00631]|uniref:hypothetical protein n=1 Tax=unclassified Streptomyces TaxID=2593676 RepID=UPI000F777EE4|nr:MULTISPECIES: hypothetical protein [unclassified Streptomyces]MCC5033645.1 hypothetical protein [Streptomyces sp. WAC 00631]MCC9742962.1 hypothetical protein [Streptomyces sp. MNU89]
MSKHDGEALPLADYDELPVGALEHRLRTLDSAELEVLRHYEHEHANRTRVLEMINTRQLQLAGGSTPSPGGEDLRQAARHSAGGSPVTPATSPEPIHPPPHGTPDQRAKPKGNRP